MKEMKEYDNEQWIIVSPFYIILVILYQIIIIVIKFWIEIMLTLLNGLKRLIS